MTAACVYKVFSAEIIVYIEKRQNYKNSEFILRCVCSVRAAKKKNSVKNRPTFTPSARACVSFISGWVESRLGSVSLDAPTALPRVLVPV